MMVASTNAVIEPGTKQAGFGIDHLSYSSLQTYSTCPKRFFFRYIAKAPSEHVPACLAYGGAVHQAIEGISEARITGQPLPKGSALLNRFDSAWNEAVKQAPEVRFAKDEDAASLRELGRKTLKAYRQQVISERCSRAKVIAIEHAVRFRLLKDAPPIEARLDLVELVGSDLVVTDYKTSRSRWNEAKAAENLPQLVLYSHAVAGMVAELGAKRIKPRFVVLTKGANPVVQIVEPAVGQQDAVRLKELAADTWGAIRAGAFPRRVGWPCKACQHSRFCMGHQPGGDHGCQA
jgi:RecB family exonuclease